MSVRLTCPQGHQWEVASVGSDPAKIAPAVCPVCGAAVALPARDAVASEAETLPPAAAREPETLPSVPRPPAESTTTGSRVTVPGYEILRELGRGGMGVVYQARQIKLSRLVALKMILAGAHAGGQELARFVTEAEAVARLQHPNIVQIYEVGEHDGLPYFSLEFCAGGSLAAMLNGTPLPPAQAAQLVETLAHAMHAAHQAGVIHRDLKPANVLLAPSARPGAIPLGAGPGSAERFDPKVTDFGLAKRLDVAGAGQTQSGAILGTPSYMAPEQAGGRTKDIGPAADVYALGAILYELLTGRPPFRAAMPLDTILQVISDEPVPPGQLNAKVPLDLETVCLKCLQKEPHKRYASAAELAEDLRRLEKGEPILARPVGRLEKVAKWARRNPVVAGSLATVLLVLTAAVSVSTYFAVDASYQAEQASSKGAGLEVANAELQQKSDALEKQSDELETTLARSLLRPLGLQPEALKAVADPRRQSMSPQQPLELHSLPLIDPEIDALWQLATSGSERLGPRFVEEALASPPGLRRLRRRAEPALHAAVGLDNNKRAQVERLLARRLKDSEPSDAQRGDVALLAVALGDLSPTTTEVVARALTQAMAKTSDPNALSELAQGLSALAGRMESQGGSGLCAQATATLGQAMAKPGDAVALFRLARAVSALAAHMEPNDAAEVAATVTRTMAKTADAKALPWLATAVTILAARMEPKEAAATLAEAMAHTTEPAALSGLALGLAAVAARMEPKHAAATLTQAIATTQDRDALSWLAQGLAGVATQVDSKAAAGAAATLAQAMSNPPYGNAQPRLAKGLSALTAQMEARDAAAILTQVIVGTRYAEPSLGQALSAVATRMDLKDAATLTRAMAETTNSAALPSLAEGLCALAARMDPKDAADMLMQAMTQATTKATNNDAPYPLAKGLSAVAARMDPKDAGRAATTLTRAMDETTNSAALPSLAEALSALAARMEPKDAAPLCAQAAATLVQAMANKVQPSSVVQGLAWALSAVAAHMEPRDAAAILTRAIAQTPSPSGMWALPPLANGLSAVAARMDPKDGVAALTQAMAKTTDAIALHALEQGLSAVAARMDPNDVAGAAASLTQEIARPTNAPAGLARGLSSLSAYMEPKESAAAAAALTQTLAKTADPNALSELGWALSTLAAHMDPNDAAAAAASLTEVMARAEKAKSMALPALAQALSALASRMQPKDATATLTKVMAQTSDPSSLEWLARGLSTVADRMEPNDAAAILTQAMTKTPDRFARASHLRTLAKALSVVAGRMEPRDAGGTATTLAQTMAQTTDAFALLWLAEGLSAVAARMEPEDAAQVCAQAAATLTQAMARTTNAHALAPLAEALSAVFACMGSKDAAPLRARAAATLTQAMAKTTTAGPLVPLLPWDPSGGFSLIGPKDASAALTQAMAQLTDDKGVLFAQDLSVVVGGADPPELSRRSAAVLGALGPLAGNGQPAVAAVTLSPALEPLPCCLPTRDLVELLKQPTCVGPARRGILDQLERRYHTQFADQWAFVRFAQDQGLDLDFTSPPKRLSVPESSEYK
jgi:hypothetical protein